MWKQERIKLSPKVRGFHLITDEVISKVSIISDCKIGILTIFIQHTSASITLNENADPSVRRDMECYFLKLVPDADTHLFDYEHDYEGPDDMPAHIKSSLLGTSVQIPICDGRLMLGTWQGIYLGEHRIHAGSRTLIATLNGEAL